jgi:hypothetical protein
MLDLALLAIKFWAEAMNQIHEPSTLMANINGNLQHGHLCRKQPILLVRFCQKPKLFFFEIKNEVILEVFNCQI